MKRLFLWLFLLAPFHAAFSQTGTYTCSRAFEGVPFPELVEFVEAESELRFYYKNAWVSDLSLGISDRSPLLPQLRRQLRPQGLELYTEGQNVVLVLGQAPLTALPAFKSIEATVQDIGEEDVLTGAEERYLQSKQIASTRVVVVGEEGKAAHGRSCSVKGKIRDASSGEPVIGATVYMEELSYGVVSDVDGNFQMNVEAGTYKVQITHVTMKAEEYYFQVLSSATVSLEMQQELKELDEVVISASQTDNITGMQMGYERVTVKSIKEIPVVLGEKDLLKVAALLPGVESVGEGSSGINVRGSAADQNMFYLNKIPVYNTSHLFGFFTTFSPDIVNDFTLYKSNIPAKYGGRLASIFDITTRQGNKKQFRGQGGISPVTAHLSFDGPVIRDKTSVIASWRSTYSDWLLNRIDNYDLQNSNAFFYDATLGVNTDINQRNTLKVFGYTSFDRFSLLDKNDYAYANTGASVSWKHIFKSSLILDLSSAYSTYSNDYVEKSNETTAFTHQYRIETIESRADFRYHRKKNHQFSFGANSTYYRNNRGDIVPHGSESNFRPVELGTEKGLEFALYVSDQVRLWNRLNLSAGLRYNFFTGLDTDEGEAFRYSKPEIRTSANVAISPNSSVKASYNRLHQYIFMLSNTIAVSPTDQWKLVSSYITPPRVDQVAIGWYQNFFRNRLETNVELYQKWIDDIVEYRDGADFLSPDPIQSQLLQGVQHARGVEFMVKKKSGKLTGWISYVYSKSYVKVDSDNGLERINQGKTYPSNFDRPHSLNLVLNQHFNRRFSLSANYIYTTGRPVTLPVAAYYAEGEPLLHFSERNQYRLPDYIRLDVSLNIEGNLKRKKVAHSFWMISVYNLLGRENAYSVYYESVNGNIKGYKLSIFAQPIVTVSWNYKFGNYLSN